MDLFQGLLIISMVHLLAAASPGPDFVLVSQQTLTNGRKAGIMCSIGISLGLSIHILYSAFGLAAVIANSSTTLWIIKILGGGYLFYLGVCGLRAKPMSDTQTASLTVKKYSAKKSIGKGVICNVLNPKAPIYFVSLFTIVLSPDMPIYQIAIYGIWIMFIQFFWFASITFFLSQPVINQKFRSVGHWIDRVLGGAMILLGIKVITSSHQ
ncbi:LysE family translocator [Aliikangiella sp. IMCC44359]|uniref:LysE family translocator n=1 Tax=Aliikangiella sp. IMCC44359 TaxID=3459125 RepID=UPI00403AD407